MTLDRSIATLLLVPLLGLTLPAAVLFCKLPESGISPVERELITFSYQPVTLSGGKPPAIFAGLECPVAPGMPTGTTTAPPGPKGLGGPVVFPPGPIPVGAAPVAAKLQQRNTAPALPSVSLIYSDGPVKTAIIDGHVLHEGASLAGNKILKIEKTRVLLRTNGKEIWLSLD
jgi:hypothetical protein